MFFLALLLIPLVVALVIFFLKHGSIQPVELGIQCAAILTFAGAATLLVNCQSTRDVEIINTSLVRKDRVSVPCSHSYQCMCHDSCTTDSRGNQSCTQVCQTCYDHSNDYDWTLFAANGHQIDIDRVDRQGSIEPKRYTIARVGDPISYQHAFENYIKAAPGTILKHEGLTMKYEGKLPRYPIDVRDYHYVDRIVNMSSLPVGPSWQRALSEINSRVGPMKQANVVLVIVEGMPREFALALEQAWVGGKKNDVVVVIDAQKSWLIDWVYVMSWTHREVFKVSLRDGIMDVGTLDLRRILPLIERAVVERFERRPMKDFEYLRSSIVPTTGQWVTSLLVSLMITLALSWFFASEHRSKRLW